MPNIPKCGRKTDYKFSGTNMCWNHHINYFLAHSLLTHHLTFLFPFILIFFFLFEGLHSNYKISPSPFLSPTLSSTTPPDSLKFTVSFYQLLLYVCMNLYILLCPQILHIYNMLNLYNATCSCVFRADCLALDNQFVYSSLRRDTSQHFPVAWNSLFPCILTCLLESSFLSWHFRVLLGRLYGCNFCYY